MKPSVYQQAVFDHIADSNKGSAIVEAVAGSGKTTTIVQACERIEDSSVLFLAFNKAIAEELKERLPEDVKAATFHSVGFGAILNEAKRTNKRVKVEGNKLRILVDEMLDADVIDISEAKSYGALAVRLVGLAKNNGIGINGTAIRDVDAWRDIIDHHNIEVEDPTGEADEDGLIDFSIRLFEASNKRNDIIDFDDMLYVPIRDNLVFQRYDFVFVDEAQDTNLIQRKVLHKLLKPHGRLIAVGDPHQAIYGFRGADADALDLIASEFNAIRLPLSISYRCPKEVVKAAQAYVSHIQASETAIEGKVESVTQFRLDTLSDNDAILSRTTAPIISLAYKLIGRGVGARVLGREIGQGLITLIKKMKARDLNHLQTKLEGYLSRETEKYLAKKREDMAQGVEDKVQSIYAAIDALDEESQSIDGLIRRIEYIFDPSRKGVTLSTVHKAKGQEWNRVFILDRQNMPSKWARQEWQMNQETNLIYVAYTRAKVELFFITSDSLV